MEKAYMRRDTAGNVVDQNRYIKCMSEGGLKFKLLHKDIDFDTESICCKINNRNILIQLHNNVSHEETMNEENNNAMVSNEEPYQFEEIISENSFHWSDASTKLFLQLYKDYKELVAQRKIKTKKIMWQKISEKMTLQGYNVSTLQVENKYKSLERSYKNIKNHNNKTGRNRLSCPYEMELTEILGGKHNIEPLLLSGNKGVIYPNSQKATVSSSTLQISADKENVINEDIVSTKPGFNEESYDEIMIDNSTDSKETPKTSKNYTKRGATARVLHTLKENVEKLSNDMCKESENRSTVQQQILEEQQKIRKVYEEFLEKTYEQTIKANVLREQRNNILKELIQISKDNH